MTQRVLGLELLRGLCALVVAIYHTLYWSNTALLPTWGLYAVYIFFGISGFVLYQNYHDRLSIFGFLLRRVARLLPLIVAAMAVDLLIRGVLAPSQMVLSATLLNGFTSPGATSFLTGQWSLGVEFVFYVVFPTLLALMASKRVMFALLAVFLGIRVVMIHFVLRDGTLADAWDTYTQPGVFLVFFFGGMVIARFAPAWRGLVFALVGVGSLAVLLAVPGPSAEAVLRGWWGLGLSVLSLLVVAAFCWSTARPVAAAVCEFFGEISYGLYLLHPLAWYATAPIGLAAPSRIAVTIVTATGVAWLSARFYERPARRWIVDRIERERATITR